LWFDLRRYTKPSSSNTVLAEELFDVRRAPLRVNVLLSREMFSKGNYSSTLFFWLLTAYGRSQAIGCGV
jgi:hypothetical protein